MKAIPRKNLSQNFAPLSFLEAGIHQTYKRQRKGKKQHIKPALRLPAGRYRSLKKPSESLFYWLKT